MPIALDVKRTFGRAVQEAVLLNGVTANDDGEWHGVNGANPLTIHIKGLTSGKAHVQGSNTPAKPLNTAHEVTLAKDIDKDDIVIVDISVKWLKVRITDYSAGTIFAYLIGQA